MADAGAEILLGMVRDPQFGPIADPWHGRHIRRGHYKDVVPFVPPISPVMAPALCFQGTEGLRPPDGRARPTPPPIWTRLLAGACRELLLVLRHELGRRSAVGAYRHQSGHCRATPARSWWTRWSCPCPPKPPRHKDEEKRPSPMSPRDDQGSARGSRRRPDLEPPAGAERAKSHPDARSHRDDGGVRQGRRCPRHRRQWRGSRLLGRLRPEGIGRSATSRLDQWRAILDSDFEFIIQFWDCPKPTIAAVHGFCLAGAFELALTCDVTVAAEGTRFGEPEPRFGSGIIACCCPGSRAEADEGAAADRHRPSRRGERPQPSASSTTSCQRARNSTRRLRSRVMWPCGALVGAADQAGHQPHLRDDGPAPGVAGGAGHGCADRGQGGPERAEFNRMRREQGLKAALEWRDARFVQE